MRAILASMNVRSLTIRRAVSFCTDSPTKLGAGPLQGVIYRPRSVVQLETARAPAGAIWLLSSNRALAEKALRSASTLDVSPQDTQEAGG